MQTGFVQVPLHLYRRLHLHVVLEEAATERGLVVGLPRRGLDGRLHPGRLHPAAAPRRYYGIRSDSVTQQSQLKFNLPVGHTRQGSWSSRFVNIRVHSPAGHAGGRALTRAAGPYDV